MADVPELGDVLRKLEDIANVKVEADTPINELDISSLDLVEWAVMLEDEYGINLEEIQLDDMRNLTPKLLYGLVVSKPPRPAPAAVDDRE
jgi:acyl carrier protein